MRKDVQGGIKMLSEDVEKVRYEETVGGEHTYQNEPVSILCPVCGKKLSNQLPCMESVVEKQIYEMEDIRIVNSEVLLECGFEHYRDEEDEDFPLEVPHLLVAVIKAAFDRSGICCQFEYLEVRLG
jgi:hypothetical protein